MTKQLASILHTWIFPRWYKQPMMFGYSALKTDTVSDTTLAAGTVTLNGATVSAGEIWVITNISMVYIGTVPTSIEAVMYDGSTAHILFNQLAPASGQYYDRQGWWVVVAGDNLRYVIYGATLNDDFYGWATGFRMDIDQ